MFKSLSLKRKILFSLLAAGLLPLLFISVAIDYQASRALEAQAFNQLISVRDIQKQQIENYFQQIRDQSETLSSNRMIVDAAKGFRFAFKLLGSELDAGSNLAQYKQALARYYQNDFANEYQKRTGNTIDAARLMPVDTLELVAQHQYIAANANPLGEKHLLDATRDGSSYDDLHERYHPAIRHYLEKFGYYDIFIADPMTGNIIYSVFKELDFATSLKTGPYKDTNFARAFRQAVDSGKASAVFLQDFEAYTPSYEAAAAFIASPIIDDGNMVGVLIFQAPVDRINAIMQQRSGLGDSGQTYLLGDDFLMRSQSPFDKDSSILRTRVESDAARAVIKDQTGEQIVELASGKEVLSAYAPVAIEGAHWGIMAEIDADEAFATITTLHFLTLALATITAAVLIAAALAFARGVYRQLGGDPTQIERIARAIADGDLQAQDDVARPTGVYAAMVSMRRNLSQSIERDIQHIVNSARKGDLSQRVELAGKQGFYQDLGTGINELVSACDNIIKDTLRVFEALSHGRLDQTYDSHYEGAFDQVKQNANATISKLRQVIEQDIQGLVNAAIAGNPEQRIELTGKEGFFKEISSGMNDLVDSVERIFADASSAIQGLAEGRLNQGIQNAYRGQFEELKRNINDSISQLDHTVISLLEAGDSISASANEVKQGSTDLSARTEQQASALEQTAASVEELTGNVRNTADNSAQAEQVANDARGTAVQGGEVMHEATRAMEEINQSSQKIAEIIGVIDEIAFQTNLLALNASVEAARAGEQGRGFAVVATEVRNLAGRSATAAKEIKELINDSVTKVGRGVSLVRQSSDNLDNIVDGITRVGTIIKEIASASHEQSSGINEVNQAINSMESLTQQNAALAEEASAAATSMSSQAQEMKMRLEFFEVSHGPMRTTSLPSKQVSPAASVAKPQPARTAVTAKAAPPAPRKAPQEPAPVMDDDDWEEF